MNDNKKLIVEIPNSLYANLNRIKNDTVAGKNIIEAVKKGVVIDKEYLRTNNVSRET